MCFNGTGNTLLSITIFGLLYSGVKGLVALTIDDCVCRQGQQMSLSTPLRELLNGGDHKATFFLTLEFSQGEWREREIKEFVRDGHELGACTGLQRTWACSLFELV
jgi:hypothetical protein